ncbi:MAG: Minf_1886 family protein [Oceanipulchritudo sp.]
MSGKNFHEVIDLIRKEDARYEAGAYTFMRQALDHTLKGILEKEEMKKHRHITGRELCEGIREFALEQYGPMARTLLEAWGIHQTEDFGQIVFNLVEFGIFGKTEEDSIQDFSGVYEFEDVFEKPFRPSRRYFPHPVPSMSDSSS